MEKKSACNAGATVSNPGSGRSPGEGNGNPLQYSWPGKSHGQRSVVGYSLWDSEESDKAEGLNNTGTGWEGEEKKLRAQGKKSHWKHL